ncbi:competence protein CoiA family protein, partial [Gemella morbillorum]
MDIKLPFGLRNEQLIHINDLTADESGLKCNCVCPACKNKLVAKLGTKNRKHFAHYSSDCGQGVETALHLYAKQFLSKELRLKLPSLKIYYNDYFCASKDMIENLAEYVEAPEKVYEYMSKLKEDEIIFAEEFFNNLQTFRQEFICKKQIL